MSTSITSEELLLLIVILLNVDRNEMAMGNYIQNIELLTIREYS